MSQRWRLSVARGLEARDLLHRDATAAWAAILEAVAAAAAPESVAPGVAPGAVPPRIGAPAGGGTDERDGGRPRVAFAAPLPLGMTAVADLVDLIIPVGRVTLDRLRAVVEPRLPAGHRLVGAHDVWIGEPSLPALVVAADYTATVTCADGTENAAPLKAAAVALLAATNVPRPGRDPGKSAANLRPLVEALAVEVSPLRVRMRLRVDQELGSGRPEEVVEALAHFGAPVTLVSARREGFILRPPPPRPPKPPPGAPRSGRPPRPRR